MNIFPLPIYSSSGVINKIFEKGSATIRKSEVKREREREREKGDILAVHLQKYV